MNATALPVLLRGGPDLTAWTLAGGKSGRAPVAWRAQLRWQAWWFANLWRQQLPRIALAAGPQQPPVLLLGLWRSGTTLLHERLAALPGHQAPLTWQCFNPASFVLTRVAASIGAAMRRPMDDALVHAKAPQEDEFALLLMGAPSLYRGFIDPRRLGSLAEAMFEVTDGTPHPPVAKSAWQIDWLRFLAGVEAMGGPTRRLVLKSPNHTLRLHQVEALWPRSQQVWIGRPMCEVWTSNLRMWRAMFARYALWSCPEGALENFLVRCIERYKIVLEAALQRHGRIQACWVDFEDLAQAPELVLHALCQFLGGQAADCSESARTEILRRHVAQPATTQTLPVPSGLEALFESVEHLHSQARSRWGWQLGR